MSSLAACLANPFVGSVPEKVEHKLSLESESIEFTTIAYNDRGTYLAAGCNTGELTIWDLATFAPALRVRNLHSSDVNSVSWVKKGKGRLICTTSGDGWLKVFDLEQRRVVKQLHFHDELIGASIHPGNLEEALVCLGGNGTDVPWPGLYRVDNNPSQGPIIRYIPREPPANAPTCYGVAATFSKHGTLVFVGGTSCSVYTFSTSSGENLRVFHPESLKGLRLPKGWTVALSLARNGKVLLSDGGGKTIAVFDVASDLLLGKHDELPLDASLDMIQDALKWRLGRILTFRRHLQDVVGATKWSDVGCSGDGEFVMAASSTRDAHELFIWDVTGHLVDTIRDTVHAFGVVSRSTWHPWRPQIATIIGSGQICLWGNSSQAEDKSWLAFAPGFVEIEENEVYQEQEEGPETTKQDPTRPMNNSSPMETEGDATPVDVLAKDTFPEIFSEDEDSDTETSIRTAPRSVTRGIGYFIQATTDDCVVDASDSVMMSTSS